MIKILVTGGLGDWAQSFIADFRHQFDITTVGRKELDVTDPLSVKQFFTDKHFDAVINNAGSIHPKRILDADADAWINDINVNLIGTFLVSKQALHANAQTTIINISSTAGFNAYPDWSSYCSSKAAVITFTKCLANDKVNAFCLCPGAIDTKFRDNLNLSNANAMDCRHMSRYVIDILNGKYTSGDVLFFRKDEFILNP
ncbi:MAG: SDR family NAD(P)-dependent oxidoreductase [Paraglaciecola sp.]|nr:SDR family NAD(P)-dependent oxidoreductase [Paraglaciecola sp.]